LDYPSGFPEHLKQPVDKAFIDAEIEFKNSRKVMGRTQTDGHILIKKYIRTVYIAFLHAACKVVAKGVWTAERFRSEQPRYLENLTRHVFLDKVWWKYHDREIEEILRGVKIQVENMDEWVTIQEELKAAIANDMVVTAPSEAHRREYRSEIRAWMTKAEIASVKDAARRLCVSETVLKSMMTTKGKKRYGNDKLTDVLKVIKSGDQS
jgi:hypothetical protein